MAGADQRAPLTRSTLHGQYRPLATVGFLVAQIVGFLTVGTIISTGAPHGQHPWRALVFGVPLGLAGGLPATYIWRKHASRLLQLPPRQSGRGSDLAFTRSHGERTPEGRQATWVWLVAWNGMMIVDAVAFFFAPMARGGAPDVLPFVTPVVTWELTWLIGYLTWWWQLPP